LEDILKLIPTEKKHNPVIFMATNCGAGGAEERTQLVSDLMKYISIDSYGGCLHNTDLPDKMKGRIYDNHGKAMRDKIELFSNYRFALVFENHNVEDYVTEKLMCALQAGTLPIYMGAPNIDEWTPGDHSIIKVSDFAGPRELGDYITYLDQNPDEYNKYFEWKKTGLLPRFKEKYDHCVFYGAECRLCQKLAQYRQQVPRPVVYEKGYALNLDSSGYVEFPHQQQFESLSTTYTITAWIYGRVFGDFRVVDKNTAGTIDGFNFDVIKHVGAAGRIRLCAAGECYQGSQSLYPNYWYHVAVIFDSDQGKVRFFIDGDEDGEHSISKPTQVTTLPLRIGATKDGSYWNGMIDEVTLHSNAISIQKIRTMMFNEIEVEDEDGLIGYYTFNEGIGTTVTDKSFYGNDGKFVGDASFAVSEAKAAHLKRFEVSVVVR